MSDDIIKRLEKINPLVATDDDLAAMGVSPGKKAEPYTPLPNQPIKFEERKPVVVPDGDEKKEKRDQDFEYMRSNLYGIVETSSNALNELAQIAARSQHPRAYEVLATLVKTIADANKDLMEIHAKKSQIEKDEAKAGNTAPKSVTNNLIIGSTAELDELCRKAIEDMKAKNDNKH